MSKSIPLTRLVSSDSFLEGSSLYRSKSMVVISVVKERKTVSVEGVIKNVPENKINFTINTDTGDILKKSCSFGCDGVCEHVIALALFYNEMEVEGINPLEQLSSFSLKDAVLPQNKLYRIVPGKKSMLIDGLLSDHQLNSILQLIGAKNLPALIALFPEKFTILEQPLKFSETPLNLMYSTQNGSIKFYLPPETYFYEESSVVINSENSVVWRFDEKTGRVLSTLLNLSMSYEDRVELAGVVSVLSRNLAPFIDLHGDINVEKVIVDIKTPIVFDTWFSKGKINLKILFNTSEGMIEFKPKRKNMEQNYPVKGKIFVIDSELIKNIRSALTATGFKLSRSCYAAPSEKYHKVVSGNSPLNSVGEVVLRNSIKKVVFSEEKADQSEIEFDLNVMDKWFSFRIKLPESLNYINPQELIKAVRQIEQGIEEPVITDSSGEPVILAESSAFLKRISEMLPASQSSSFQKLPFGHLLKMLNSDNRKVIKNFYGPKDAEEIYRGIFASIRKGQTPDIDIPEIIGSSLRSYQKEGLKWFSLLRNLRLGGVLADEMGLGKTLQALAMIKMEGDDLPSMVIAPKTLIWSWDREIEKFYPDMKRVVIDSLKPEERIRKWKNFDNELIITSYAIVVNDLKYLKDKNFKTIIVDEAQHIKNCQTKRFRSLVSLKSEHKFALTGTPIENHIRDLWSIFQFVMPGYLGNRKDIDSIEKRGEQGELIKLASLTAPFILRRTKKETLNELPELTVKECPVEMTIKQKEVYLSVLLRGRAEYLENKEEMTSLQILSILSRLRLAANHPSLVKEADYPVVNSGKILTILELVDEIILAEGKVLIFSQYVKMLKLIEKALVDQNIEYFYMDGQTKERIELVEKFNSGEKPVFLLSLKVGGVGLNLTGADNVIIVDPWWNPAAEEQAWSRAHRIGQEKRVTVHKLFSKGTIEEKIIDMQERKKGLTDHFMSRTIKNPSEDFIKMVADMELSING